MEQLTGIINVFSPEDSAGDNKQSSDVLACKLGLSYHGHHLQVLQIRPFCGQQLLCDEVGPICSKPLQKVSQQREDTEQKLLNDLLSTVISPASVWWFICCMTRPISQSGFSEKYSASVSVENYLGQVV